MRLDDKLKKLGHEQLWQEYCGFVDMSLSEYMYTQRRLMEEQLTMWCNSGLGRQMLRGAQPRSIEELRAMLPLTSPLSSSIVHPPIYRLSIYRIIYR